SITLLYTLSLHDALPIYGLGHVNNTVLPVWFEIGRNPIFRLFSPDLDLSPDVWHLILVRTEFDFLRQMYFRSDVEIRTFITKIRSEEHTSELQSRENLVC